ncbi:glycosyltransferase family 92 protein RCOM_0530710-like [Malus sylvestris]|uniref:glycosyltransferase family 92 protein RCOM_0530710-like n=1 Tax=Malus sylvestris TaxID=3752 RepID=UPI0021ABFF33|nr:glycosyltransferase family 92 protein RCOM_0530710-like [Malus sylvestris]
MDSSEQRRKRKRMGRSYLQAKQYLSLRRPLVLCFSFFIFLLFVSSGRFRPASFRPVLTASSTTLSLLSSTASNSILESFAAHSKHSKESPPSFRVQDRILFPDHVLLIVPNRFRQNDELECVYHKRFNGSDDDILEDKEKNQHLDFAVRPVLSTDSYDDFRSIVRCPLPPLNFSTAVDLRRRGSYDTTAATNGTASPWDKVVYEAVIDGDTAVVFVKGLNLRPHKNSDPTRLSCHFGLGNWDKDKEQSGFVLTTEAVTAAQEVVRCLLPRTIRNHPDKAHGIRVTIGYNTGHPRAPVHVTLPSVATIHNSKSHPVQSNPKKHELCVCTMLWNQAPAIKEWIMYHSWLGVERWFIYDNNSDDGIEDVVRELDSQDYNVSRQSWPWIKTQEAGFSHCALRAKDECNWVGFFDVDEFFYFPLAFHRGGGDYGVPGENSLRKLVSNFSNSATIAEIRTDCHSFGPSGLSSQPPQGVTVGYTCRLQSPERHKSIVRTELLDVTLLNVVHHFRLREGYRYLSVPEGIAVINHYKYQVWETFRAKFFRRVATYVVDWQEDQNQGSKDRAPGLGTEAVEPPNWRLRFCEVWDTGLKDFVLGYFADPVTRLLPWEKKSLTSAE